MAHSDNAIPQLRKTMQSFARGRVKAAVLGGEPDMPFEQAFSSLAHAYLKDKAPSLLDYEVGFQLIDRNEENTKAVGVFGFKVGKQWLYAPVFFLNGDLKGHELLYIKNQDVFVPLKEDWLNYLLNRKPDVLGTSIDRNLNQAGVTPPHLYQLARSPYKFASATQDKFSKLSSWARDAVPTIAYIATTNPKTDAKYKDLITLPDFLKKEGKVVIRSLVKTFEENPKLAQMIDNLHGLNIIDNAIKHIQSIEDIAKSNSVIKEAVTQCEMTFKGLRCGAKPSRVRKPSVLPDPSNEVNSEPGDTLKMASNEMSESLNATMAGTEKAKRIGILTLDEVMHAGTGVYNLPSDDREKLVKDKVIIKDERDKASRAYEMQSLLRLQNPNETGLYDVLVKANKFEKCLLIHQPYDQRSRKDFVTVIRVGDGDGNKAWMNIHNAHVWVGYQYSNKEYQEYWDKLKAADSLPEGRDNIHVVIGNTYEGSLPFSVHKSIGSSDRKSYDVYFYSHAEKDRPYHLPPIKYHGLTQQYYDRPWVENEGCRITLTGKRGASLRCTGGDLYVPADYKLLTLRSIDDDDFGMCGCDAHSEPPPIQPGNQFDIDLLIGTKTAAMKIYHDGTEVDINGLRMPPISGLIHLVRDHGLREKTARELLKRAEKHKVARARIEYAEGYSEKLADQGYDMQKDVPSAPGMPDPYIGHDPMTSHNYPTMQPSEFNLPVTDMSTSKTDREQYRPLGPDPKFQTPTPDRDAQQSAMQAGASGQKEVFDTSMIASLLKAVRDDSMVDRYLGDLMKGLDRLGRILFLFYWHGDKFENRYGKGEMIELEDGLRDAFERLGDIVLFLKQRSIESEHDMDLGTTDMSTTTDE